jgi:thioredoxin reductase
MTYDVVVIGGGAAGLSAALMLARARRRVLVVDSGLPRNKAAGHVHGFLSRDGMPPGRLLAEGRREVWGYGGEIVPGAVTSIDPGFTVTMADLTVIQGRRLLFATGLTDELPDIPGLRERWGREVYHCPYCHGWEVRDQPLGVIGDPAVAGHMVKLLGQWSDDVVLLPQSEVESIRDDGAHMSDGSVARRTLFVVPRFVANSELLVKLGCEVGEGGFVRTDPTGLTTVPGVWAAGNVVDPRAQVITAAGAGSTAAVAINADLLGLAVR